MPRPFVRGFPAQRRPSNVPALPQVPSRVLHIRNLPEDLTEADLRSIASSHGQVHPGPRPWPRPAEVHAYPAPVAMGACKAPKGDPAVCPHLYSRVVEE